MMNNIQPAYKSGKDLTVRPFHIHEDADIHMRFRRIVKSCQTLGQLKVAESWGKLAMKQKLLVKPTFDFYLRFRGQYLQYKYFKLIEFAVFGHELTDTAVDTLAE